MCLHIIRNIDAIVLCVSWEVDREWVANCPMIFVPFQRDVKYVKIEKKYKSPYLIWKNSILYLFILGSGKNNYCVLKKVHHSAKKEEK